MEAKVRHDKVKNATNNFYYDGEKEELKNAVSSRMLEIESDEHKDAHYHTVSSVPSTARTESLTYRARMLDVEAALDQQAQKQKIAADKVQYIFRLTIIV